MAKQIKVVMSYDYKYLVKILQENEHQDVELLVETNNNPNQEELFLRTINSLLMNSYGHIIINGERVFRNTTWPSQILANQKQNKASIELNILPIYNNQKVIESKTKEFKSDIHYSEENKFLHKKKEFKQILSKFIKRLNSLYSPKRICGQYCTLFISPTGYKQYAKTNKECPKGYTEKSVYYEVERSVNIHTLMVELNKISYEAQEDAIECIKKNWKGRIFFQYNGSTIESYQPEYKEIEENLHILDEGKPLLSQYRKCKFFVKEHTETKTKSTYIAKPKVSYVTEEEKTELLLIQRIYGIFASERKYKNKDNQIDIIKLIETLDLPFGSQGFNKITDNINYIKQLIMELDYDVIYTTKPGAVDDVLDMFTEQEELDKELEEIETVKTLDEEFWEFTIRKLKDWKEYCKMLNPLYDK